MDETTGGSRVALHLERSARARRREASLATFPGRVPAGHGRPRGDPRRHGRESPRQLGRWPGRPRPARHRHPVRSRRAEREPMPARSTTTSSHRCEGVRRCCRTLDLEATPPFDYAHDHFGYRDRLSQPVIEGLGRGADARLGRAAQGRRVHPRLPRRGRTAGQSATAGSPLAQRQLHGVSPTARARRQRSATSCASTARRPTSRSCWPRSSWAAGAAALRWCSRRTRTTPRSAPTRSATTTSTTRRWTRIGYAVPLGRTCATA